MAYVKVTVSNLSLSYRPLFFLVLFVLFGASCTLDSEKNHYQLAEKLWMDQKYSAAVAEFEKVSSKNFKSPLGLRALYQSAMIQIVFLGQYAEAIQKLNLYIQTSQDPKSRWEARLQIGETLFSKMEQYDQAIAHYQEMLRDQPQVPEAAEFYFRIGKSYFFLFQFKDAISVFQKLVRNPAFTHSKWVEKAAFELGTCFFTRGAQRAPERRVDTTIYHDAIKAYRLAIEKYPESEFVPEARFGIVSCLEEMDQLEEAYRVCQQLQSTYPALPVIQMKLARIRERLAQKNRQFNAPISTKVRRK